MDHPPLSRTPVISTLSLGRIPVIILMHRQFDETSPLIGSRTAVITSPDSIRNNGDERVGTDEPTPISQIAASMLSFLILGMFSSTTGTLLPYFEQYYSLNDVTVALIFPIPAISYIVAAQLNNSIHSKFGKRGNTMLGPTLHFIYTLGGANHPQFPVFVLFLSIYAAGAGFIDSPLCAWAAAMKNGNIVSGFLHGSFSVGAGLGPYFIGTLAKSPRWAWFKWYYILTFVSLVELAVLTVAFRNHTAERYRATTRRSSQPKHQMHLRAVLSQPATWACAAYLLFYVGTEAAISGWMVMFMIRHQHATVFVASTSISGFWMGMAVGRLCLGSVTDKIGTKLAVPIYFLSNLALLSVSMALTNSVSCAITFSFIGFFCGPLFPCAIVQLTTLLPTSMHITAVSFVSSIGQVGSALLPFGLGVLTQIFGIWIFQGLVFIQLCMALLAWVMFSRLPPIQEDDRGTEDSVGNGFAAHIAD